MIRISNIKYQISNIQKGFVLSERSESKGFTLTELLIVIAIIGILSTLVIVNLINVRQRARDAQRKSDIRQIQSALELYRADQGSYYPNSALTSPQNVELNSSPCPAATSLSANSVTYMQAIPCDPLGVSGTFNNGNYYYYSDGTTYTLIACLENTSDNQGVSTFPSGLPGASSACNSGGTANYFVVTNP